MCRLLEKFTGSNWYRMIFSSFQRDTTVDELTKRKLLRASCHAAALTSWSVVTIGVPIALLIFSRDQLVCDSAKEAINFSINLFVWTTLAGVLFFTIIGVPLAFLIWGVAGLAALILPIIAIVSVCVDPARAYRYPGIVRLIKSNSLAPASDTRA